MPESVTSIAFSIFLPSFQTAVNTGLLIVCNIAKKLLSLSRCVAKGHRLVTANISEIKTSAAGDLDCTTVPHLNCCVTDQVGLTNASSAASCVKNK